jgi:hypothetical protein
MASSAWIYTKDLSHTVTIVLLNGGEFRGTVLFLYLVCLVHEKGYANQWLIVGSLAMLLRHSLSCPQAVAAKEGPAD